LKEKLDILHSEKEKEEKMSLFPAYSNDKTKSTNCSDIGNYFRLFFFRSMFTMLKTIKLKINISVIRCFLFFELTFFKLYILISDNASTEWLSNSSFQTQFPIKKEPPDLYSSSDESLHEFSLNAEKQIFETMSRDTKVQTRQKIDKGQKVERKRRTHDSKRYKPDYELDVENV